MTLRKTYTDIIVIVIGFCVLGYLTHIYYLYWIAITVAVLSISPYMAHKISYGWEKLGKTLGWINSRVLLSLFFVVVITPIAFLYRTKKTKHSESSDWKDSSTKNDFTKPW
jgi:uncharacterized membrane protein